MNTGMVPDAGGWGPSLSVTAPWRWTGGGDASGCDSQIDRSVEAATWTNNTSRTVYAAPAATTIVVTQTNGHTPRRSHRATLRRSVVCDEFVVPNLSGPGVATTRETSSARTPGTRERSRQATEKEGRAVTPLILGHRRRERHCTLVLVPHPRPPAGGQPPPRAIIRWRQHEHPATLRLPHRPHPE